ncbi:MAG: NCS1 family nucleobase:cation symporter-1, partial [Pseudomonas sp.]|nr:NCS1 family nucleobase:cation symporter-1 [Pseudomonas sp.]
MQQNRSQVIERNGLYELDAGPDVLDSPRYNHDMAPTKVHERTWNKWHITALWVGMSICVPTYTLGGVLTAYFGLSVGEALVAILLANIVVLIPLTLNAFPGTKYGIPFPVLLRSSFGILGSNVPCLIRALVACGWFGIQTMFGGLAIHLFLGSIFDGWKALGGTGEVIGFMLFWCLNLWVVLRGAESIKRLETLSAPLLVAVGVGLLVWAMPNVSLSELMAIPPKRPEGASLTGYFMAGLTAMVGFWATLSLNIPDFSRYAKSQKDQILGQIFGLPLTMFLFAALGVVMTAASVKLVGVSVSDPVSLIGHIQSPVWVAIAMALIIVATLSTNTAANIVSPTNDFQNIAPKLINRTTAVILTGLVGLALMAHELLKKLGLIVSDVSLETVYSNWLLGYSSLLGPIAGIMVVDYFITRRQQLDLAGLYRDDVYPAWNWSGFVAFGVPVVLT